MLNEENRKLIKESKGTLNFLKSWKTVKQKKYLVEYLDTLIEDIPRLSFEDKREILLHSICLSRKSYMNIIAKNFNMSLNDDENIKMWTVLENCEDNQYAINIMKEKKDWNDFSDTQYFFEQVLKFGKKYYTSKNDKILSKKLKHVIAERTDVNFWLSKEKKTGLSKLSYLLIKNEYWGTVNQEVIDIKPGWLDKDYYNIVSNENNEEFQLIKDNTDWNKIIRTNEEYSEEAKKVVRHVLDNLWLQKDLNGKYVFENDKIKVQTLAEMWLFNEKHFKYEIFTTEEKTQLLEKVLNQKDSFINIKSATKDGKFTRMVINECFKDEDMKWNLLKLDKNALNALKLGEYDKIVNNLILKSKLENDLKNKNKGEKKFKI